MGEELRQAETRGEPDNVSTYYNAALKALERIVVEYGGISAEAVSERRDAWEDAYLSTPNAQGKEEAQHLYSVVFDAQELWPEAGAGRDRVFLDLWESYLEAG